MATLNLGRIKPVFRGAYNNSTAYVVDDIVTSGGSSYICIQASTGNAVSNATYWTQMAAGGTDVGTTLTTQGDILYRDGSGLQRLPKGTANQVLKMNSGATAPEYGDLSSDFVKLHETTLTSNATTVSIDGHFTSDYRHYFIQLDILPANSSTNFYMRFNVGGSVQSNSVYRGLLSGSEKYNSGHNFGTQGSQWYDNDYALVTGHSGTQSNNDNYGGAHVTQWLYHPLDTTRHTFLNQLHVYNNDANNNIIMGYGGHTYQSNSAVSGITYFPSNGDYKSGSNFKLYGIK